MYYFIAKKGYPSKIFITTESGTLNEIINIELKEEW